MFDLKPACADVQVVDHRNAVVKTTPTRKKVALIGFATNTLHLVPWDKPEFEIWGMNQGYLHCHRYCDRWFEMHSHEYVEDVRDPAYMKFLQEYRNPIYMIDTREDIKNSVRYPIEAAIQLAGRDYFTSTIAFMMALAVMEGFEDIHLYGINLAIGDEYFYEKPCAEWWIGFAEGRGVHVYVPQASSLLKQYARYGYAPQARPNALTKMLIDGRVAAYQSECEGHLRDYHIKLGAMREGQMLKQIIEGQEHGADVVIVKGPSPSTST